MPAVIEECCNRYGAGDNNMEMSVCLGFLCPVLDAIGGKIIT